LPRAAGTTQLHFRLIPLQLLRKDTDETGECWIVYLRGQLPHLDVTGRNQTRRAGWIGRWRRCGTLQSRGVPSFLGGQVLKTKAHDEKPVSRHLRRALIVYLVAYYLLIAAAVVTLWRSGLMTHLHRGWTCSAIAVAVALGLVLWATSRG
jgi:hypothetical protein